MSYSLLDGVTFRTTLYCSTGQLRDSGDAFISSLSLKPVPHHVLGARHMMER